MRIPIEIEVQTRRADARDADWIEGQEQWVGVVQLAFLPEQGMGESMALYVSHASPSEHAAAVSAWRAWAHTQQAMVPA